jgi:hypothetical protein
MTVAMTSHILIHFKNKLNMGNLILISMVHLGIAKLLMSMSIAFCGVVGAESVGGTKPPSYPLFHT